MLGFRISNLVGGKGTLAKQLKVFSHLPWTSASLPVPCHRVTHHAARYPALQKTAASSRAGPKSLRHQVFPGGPPSKYYPGPTMLNFRDQTRTGVFIVVWS